MTVEKIQKMTSDLMALGNQLGKAVIIKDLHEYMEFLRKMYKIIDALIDEQIRIGTGV